jgi:hypothetical protein
LPRSQLPGPIEKPTLQRRREARAHLSEEHLRAPFALAHEDSVEVPAALRVAAEHEIARTDAVDYLFTASESPNRIKRNFEIWTRLGLSTITTQIDRWFDRG